MNIVCVLKDRQNFTSNYDPSWVQKLARGVKRHFTSDHRFVCLTNHGEIEGVETIPLIHHTWGDYWAKIEIFRPELFSGPTIYTDLDALICNNIDRLAEPEDEFLMLEDYYPHILNSTLMKFDASNKLYSGIYTYFAQHEFKVKREYAPGSNGANFGDQLYISEWLQENGQFNSKWQDVLPRELFLPFSYRSELNPDVLDWKPGNPAAYVYCLGHPKFDALQSCQIVSKNWK